MKLWRIVLLLLSVSAPAAGQVVSVSPSSIPTQQKETIVCNRTGLTGANGTSGGTSPRQNSQWVMVCPRGAKTVRLMFPGIYTAPAETDLTSPIPIHAGVKVTSGNSNLSTYLSFTCNGSRECLVPVTIQDNVGQGYILTDPLPINCVAPCTVTVNTYVNQAVGAVIANGRLTVSAVGDGGAAVIQAAGDLSLTGVTAVNGAGLYGPVAVIGIPQTYGPTVCILGDSIAAGIWGLSLQWYTTPGITAGGSGFVQGDVGAVMTLQGGTFGTAAQVTIAQVNGGSGAGAVTGISVTTQGNYATTPATPVSAIGSTTGSGLTVTPLGWGSTTFEPGDGSGNFGYVERALGNAIPWMSFARSSDKTANWVTRDYGRIAMIQRIGCTSVLDELDINDITAATSVATMEANDQYVWQQIIGLGISVFTVTNPPGSVTSSDGFVLLSNETAYANDTNRTTLNDWKRNNWQSLGLAGYFEVADTIESARNSGKIKVTGAVAAYTGDGTHFFPTGMTAAQAAITLGALR